MTILELHNKAQSLLDEAYLAKKSEEDPVAHSLLTDALRFESEAASMLKDRFDAEPTRSIIYRSAAIIALQCHLPREAEQFVSQGLAGNPPEEIAEELRDLFEEVNFHRHLAQRKIVLADNEIDFTLLGNEVAHGMILFDEFVNRVHTVGQFTLRTTERVRNEPYRSVGAPKPEIANLSRMYLGDQMASSYRVKIRIGTAQMSLFDSLGKEDAIHTKSFTTIVVEKVIDWLKDYENSELERLRDKIADDDYYHNLVGLAKKLSPDGERIKSVVLSTSKVEDCVVMRKPRSQIKTTIYVPHSLDLGEESLPKPKSLTGVLFVARATKHSNIMLRLSDKEEITIRVPRGLLSDVVKPHFDERVTVELDWSDQKKQTPLLVDIVPAPTQGS